jgi:hypothetical protein
MRRQRRSAGLPAKADRAGGLAIPDPAPEARQARPLRAVGQGKRRPFRLAIVEAVEERHRVFFDGRELLARRFQEADIVRRPAAFERRLVGRQVFERGLDDLDHAGFRHPMLHAFRPTSPDSGFRRCSGNTTCRRATGRAGSATGRRQDPEKASSMGRMTDRSAK